MGLLRSIFGMSGSGPGVQKNKTEFSPKTIQVPRTEPGWNINAEGYFGKELKPLSGTEIDVVLQIVDQNDGGWDETNLLYRGSKVGQLPNSYHQRMGTVLRELRARGQQLQCTAYVFPELDLTLLAPFPEKLIPFIPGVHPADPSNLESGVRQPIGNIHDPTSGTLYNSSFWA